MPNQSWKNEEREVARILSGTRIPLSLRYDVETMKYCVEVKYRRQIGLADIELAWTKVKMHAEAKGKIPIVVVKRKAGNGINTPRFVIMDINDFIKIDSQKEEESRKLLYTILEVE